jgi:uncharacterized protein (TIGR02145 family)
LYLSELFKLNAIVYLIKNSVKLNFLVCVKLFVLLILFLTISCKKDTPKQITTILTTAITNTGPGTLSGGGDIVSDGGDPITARGVCWSLKQHSYTAYDSTMDGTGSGKFTSTITGLKPGYKYYIKAYAINKYGVNFGGEYEITINPVLPWMINNGVISVTTNSILVRGYLASPGGAVTTYGFCWSTNQHPTIADNTFVCTDPNPIFDVNITGLAPATTYYIRPFGTNIAGTAYGTEIAATTKALLPTITTNNVTDMTTISANCGGTITSDGGASITKRGIMWSELSNPSFNITDIKTNETNTGALGTSTYPLSNLLPNTTYYVRAYCLNSSGYAYGDILSFTTPDIYRPTVSDIDGNVYHVLTIGTQQWLMENLKVTHYRNGDPIANVTGNAEWTALSTGAYCWYENHQSNMNPFGALYNYYAFTDTRNICPPGWHVPTSREWQTLADYLGGKTIAGAKLKQTGIVFWDSPNYASNESFFTGLPGGSRNDLGGFSYIRTDGYWWGVPSNPLIQGGWVKKLHYDYQSFDDYQYVGRYGLSVRCIKD